MFRWGQARVKISEYLRQLFLNTIDYWLHHVERIHVKLIVFSVGEDGLNKLEVLGRFYQINLFRFERHIP